MADGRRLAMNLLQIQYLLDAVEMNSIHKSAEKYNISPQGASKAFTAFFDARTSCKEDWRYSSTKISICRG